MTDRSVPEHHDIYDTRSHVPVEVDAIKDAIVTVTESDNDDLALEMIYGWLRELVGYDEEEAFNAVD